MPKKTLSLHDAYRLAGIPESEAMPGVNICLDEAFIFRLHLYRFRKDYTYRHLCKDLKAAAKSSRSNP